jgi:L-seryl-tRNA(Ser) seleniumtransferase
MLKILGGIPLVGVPFMKVSANTFVNNSEMPALPTPNLFDELGIEPLINAQGTVTRLSGTLMRPDVMRAINSTAHEFANMHEVIDKTGERIAELLNCEAAMVTAGAASAIVLGTAACITGTDREKIENIPHLDPVPEVIMQKEQRYVFDHCARMTGAKIVEVESAREMERAINENTVMALFFNAASSWYGKDHAGNISRKEFVKICKRNNIPSFNDAAADTPPVEHLFKYQEMGFDLVAFSGGKMIRGPQSTGLLLSRNKDLIEAAKLNFDPYESPIGRPQKVNKEEIFAMYVALRDFLKMDHEKQLLIWDKQIKHIKDVVETVPGVTGKKIVNPGPANAFPGLSISWDQSRVSISPQEVHQELKEGKPKIMAGGGKRGLHIAVVTLKPPQIDMVAQRVKKIMQAHAV